MKTQLSNRRILVVEDSATQAHQLRIVLEAAGFAVVVATNGPDGLRVFETGTFDLVLSDVVMPGLSGYDLCRRIKAKGDAAVPVILLTALEQPTDIIRGLACGADNFIRKPFDIVHLLDRVNHVLSVPRIRLAPPGEGLSCIPISFMGEELAVDCSREQILEFLLSTFADYIHANEREREIKAIESRQRAELEQSRVREDDLRNLLESFPEAMVIMDGDGKVTLVNSRLEELYGYCRQDLIGEPADALLAGSRWADLSKGALGRPVADMTVADDPIRGRRKNGDEFPAQISIRPISASARGLMAASIRDITRQRAAQDTLRRQAQELARSNADLEKFAYVASHDLQEPLRVVAGYMQLFEKRYGGKLDPEAKGIIERVVGAVNRMKTLIEDLLAYSRVGTRGEEFAPVNCQEAVTQALENLRVAVEESQAQVTIDALPTIMADAGQLRQLFQNLLSNAIKYRSQRPPEIHITSRREGETWRIAVSDNGIGIDPQYWERIFVIFQRLHTVREYPGTGIGLAICKRIVERHGGTLKVESVAGQGSTFHFSVPALPLQTKEVADDRRAA